MNSDQGRKSPKPIDVSWRAFSIFAIVLFAGMFAYYWWAGSQAGIVFVIGCAIICLVGLALRLIRRRRNRSS